MGTPADTATPGCTQASFVDRLGHFVQRASSSCRKLAVLFDNADALVPQTSQEVLRQLNRWKDASSLLPACIVVSDIRIATEAERGACVRPWCNLGRKTGTVASQAC